MSNQFTSIGFDVRDAEDADRLSRIAADEGDPIAAPAGYYMRHVVDSHIELWGQATPTVEVVGCLAHYAGESRIRLGVGDLISRRDQPLEGSVYGWANPTGARADNGDYPLVVRILDFDIFRTHVSPHAVVTLQITAYPQEIAAYPDDLTFESSQQQRMKLAPESFIPAGLFSDAGDIGVGPPASAIFSGHVQRSDLKVNGLTGNEYRHLLVSTYGGVYDVVAGLDQLPDAPAEGSVIRGSFHLMGRLAA